MLTWTTTHWRQASFPVRENLEGDLEWRVDTLLLAIVVALMCISWIMVSSASIDYAKQMTGNPFYFSIRHGVYMLMAWLFMASIMLVPFNTWRRIDKPFLLFAIVLLLVVLVPGIGRRINGSQRWINLGFMTLQASEVAKWAMMIFLSGYFVRQRDELQRDWLAFLLPFFVVGLLAVLLLLEPDFGATVVIGLSSLTLMFLAGAPLGRFSMLVLCSVALLGVVGTAASYRMDRLTAFWDPWDEDVMYGSGYQLTQSLIAIGRGEWFGVGLGNSIQKQFYLPEAHTDFVFSIWAEETGFIGSLAVIALFAGMVWRVVSIARQAMRRGEEFGALCVMGIMLVVAYQAFINMGVASGLLPTKGLTLPFISYGGSSLIISAGMLGMVLRLSFENRVDYPIERTLVMAAGVEADDD